MIFDRNNYNNLLPSRYIWLFRDSPYHSKSYSFYFVVFVLITFMLILGLIQVFEKKGVYFGGREKQKMLVDCKLKIK